MSTARRVAPVLATTILLLVGLLVRVGAADEASTDVTAGRGGVKATTSANKYGWHPAIFDFGWEYGESLTDKPARGKRLRGGWVDASNGSGRAALHNAGLMLESKFGRVRPGDAGPGDHGTTSVTLRGNAQTYGRWEVRIRPWVIESGGRDYRVRFELVPDDPTKRACGARSITVADVTPRQPEVRFGAFTPVRSKAWRGRVGSLTISRVARAYAVEVARDHISWFVDGRLVGTVRDSSAIPGVPLTIRLSLVGSEDGGGQLEMNHTYAIMDWVRAYGIKNGQHPKRGARLTTGKHPYGC
ncbi:MAG TPA: hypothetical protein VFK41_00440 [Nocardioidaceae bacterium]|nr:hypothetical protein [Nocardioidaceae bacterium]